MRVELTASELGEIHAGKRIKRFACTPEDPCDILGIEFSDGTAVVFDAHFELDHGAAAKNTENSPYFYLSLSYDQKIFAQFGFCVFKRFKVILGDIKLSQWH